MRIIPLDLALTALFAAAPSLAAAVDFGPWQDNVQDRGRNINVQLGPRPFFLVEDMAPSALKRKLQSCANGPFRKSDFSIGHRGAALQFPEHTKESYEAAARMGAGILECDVTFTRDKELVCRHSQCDLHTTTDILATPLAAKCSAPFQPAQYDAAGNLVAPATATCCTSDITLAEFKTLRGKMDASNPRARTVAEYLGGTPGFRTDLYAGPSSGTLVTHKESIELFKRLGAKMTPELKSPSVPMPFDGFTQQDYAQKLIDEYKAAGVHPGRVYAQSFNLPDVLYWIGAEPAFGRQAVFFDDIDPTDANPYNDRPRTLAELQALAAQGVKIVAPPMWALLARDASGRIVPAQYALDARAAGLDLITWTLERSGVLADGDGGWYYQSLNGPALDNEGVTLEALHVLAQEVGVLGIFSDWPATVTYYANCMGLK
jgi:glycerophosphoryl diester phosphodiesterase